MGYGRAMSRGGRSVTVLVMAVGLLVGRWRERRDVVGWLGPSRLTLDDLAQVACREPDPPPVQVERHLPAVRASAEGALSHLGQAEASEDLGGLGRGEQPRETEQGFRRPLSPGRHLPDR